MTGIFIAMGCVAAMCLVVTLSAPSIVGKTDVELEQRKMSIQGQHAVCLSWYLAQSAL